MVAAPDPDPRVYFSAERTLLAWLRTGITIMAFGVVVARFGLFLQLLQAQGGPSVEPGLSQYIGSALVGLGVLATAAGAIEYRRFCQSIPRSDRPRSSSRTFILGLSWSLVMLGLVLGIHLLP